jgi:hypothetical protein
MPTDQRLLREAEALLEQIKDLEPLTHQEVCDWLDIRPVDFPRWAQANLERGLESISTMARAFRDRDDAESVALVRQIDARIAEVRRSIRYWISR